MHIQMVITILMAVLINVTFAAKTNRYQSKIPKQNTVCPYTGHHGRCYDPAQTNNYDPPHMKKHYRGAEFNRLKNKKTNRYQSKIPKQNTVCPYTGHHGRCYDPAQTNNYDPPHMKKHYRGAEFNRLKKKKTNRYQSKIHKQNTVCSYTGLHSRCYDPIQTNNYDAPHVKKHYRGAEVNQLNTKKNPYQNSHKKHGRNKQIQPSIYNEQQFRPHPQTSKLIPDLPLLFKDYDEWFGNYDDLYFAYRYPDV